MESKVDLSLPRGSFCAFAAHASRVTRVIYAKNDGYDVVNLSFYRTARLATQAKCEKHPDGALDKLVAGKGLGGNARSKIVVSQKRDPYCQRDQAGYPQEQQTAAVLSHLHAHRALETAVPYPVYPGEKGQGLRS